MFMDVKNLLPQLKPIQLNVTEQLKKSTQEAMGVAGRKAKMDGGQTKRIMQLRNCEIFITPTQIHTAECNVAMKK